MTPGARLAAAIDVLDDILNGTSPERALTGWGRRSRFAGSKDRRAVRDHVFDALRRRRSYGALGGSDTGRGLMIGALRSADIAPETLMTGEGHAPAPPGPSEASIVGTSPAVEADLPDWLYDRFRADLGEQAHAAAMALRDRAPVFVRANAARTTLAKAVAALASDGIVAQSVDSISSALEVTENAAKINQSTAYTTGLIELQDASSQAAVLALPLQPGDSVLDFCAGGGGKTLAMAARMDLRLTAHDALPQRMRDLITRAARARQTISQQTLQEIAGQQFDLVLVDAPCSGSGTWRRDPAGKWGLTPAMLDDLSCQQLEILTQASVFVRPNGVLAYATCSVIRQENQLVIERFCSDNPEYRPTETHIWLAGAQGDGFFLSVLERRGSAT